MQFNIRDLLFVTSVVVLVVVACIRYRAADRIDSQVTKARFEVKSLQDSIVRSKQYLPNYEPRMDYVGQIQQAHGAAAADFDNVRKRYSKIEPKPGKVVAREIPEYGDLNPKHLRLHIPQEYPVYLRSAIKAKQDSPSDDSSSRLTLFLHGVLFATAAASTWRARLQRHRQQFDPAREKVVRLSGVGGLLMRIYFDLKQQFFCQHQL